MNDCLLKGRESIAIRTLFGIYTLRRYDISIKPYPSLLKLLIFLILSNDCFAQRDIILKGVLKFKEPPFEYLNNNCDFEILIPDNQSGKQEIIDYHFSIKPTNLIKAPEGELVANWKNLKYSDFKNSELEVQIKMRLLRYDLTTAKKHPILNINDLDTLKYLQEEENFQVNSELIKSTADTIRGKNREDIVHHIFDFVMSRLEYKIFDEQDRSAKKALKQGKGDCTEYSELMVTLCRAKNIPARIKAGFTLKNNNEIGYHNWVEVFFSKYGWVMFDPTFADHPNVKTTFSNLLDVYILLSNRRFISRSYSKCQPPEFRMNYEELDTYSSYDFLKEEKTMFDRMYHYYNSNEWDKALNLIDTLIDFKTSKRDYYRFKGVLNARKGNFDKGIECLQISLSNAKTEVSKSQSFYSFANYFALKGENELAIKYLKKSIELGYKDYDVLMSDVDFDNLKDYPPFIELENLLKSKLEKK